MATNKILNSHIAKNANLVEIKTIHIVIYPIILNISDQTSCINLKY